MSRCFRCGFPCRQKPWQSNLLQFFLWGACFLRGCVIYCGKELNPNREKTMTPAGTCSQFPIPTWFDTAGGYACANIVSASRATVSLSTSDTSKVRVSNPVPDTPPSDVSFSVLFHRLFPASSVPRLRAFLRSGGKETCESVSTQHLKLNRQAYQPIKHNI